MELRVELDTDQWVIYWSATGEAKEITQQIVENADMLGICKTGFCGAVSIEPTLYEKLFWEDGHLTIGDLFPYYWCMKDKFNKQNYKVIQTNVVWIREKYEAGELDLILSIDGIKVVPAIIKHKVSMNSEYKVRLKEYKKINQKRGVRCKLKNKTAVAGNIPICCICSNKERVLFKQA